MGKKSAKIKKRKIKELKKYNNFFKLFSNANSETRSKAISKMDPKCLSMLCECTLNVLKNPQITNNAQKNYLKQHFQEFRPQLLNFTQDNISFTERKQLCHYLRNCIGCMMSIIAPTIDKL
jgi:hypothetical protein